jgi:hypothetical protein
MCGKGDKPLFKRIGLSKSFVKLKPGHRERNRQGQIPAGEEGGVKGEKRKEKKIRGRSKKFIQTRNPEKKKRRNEK